MKTVILAVLSVIKSGPRRMIRTKIYTFFRASWIFFRIVQWLPFLHRKRQCTIQIEPAILAMRVAYPVISR